MWNCGGLHTATRAHPPPPPRLGRAPGYIFLAAHAVESKAVVRIEVAVSPRPCLGCAVELVLRVAPLRRSNFWPSSAARPPGAINRPQGVAMRHLGCYYMTGPPGTSPLRWRRHWAINAGTSCSSQLCHDCSFGWVLAGLETTDPATGGAAGLETDKGRAGERRGGGGGTTSTTAPAHRLQGRPHVVADPHQTQNRQTQLLSEHLAR
jgi:hypothetical protein